MKRKFWKQKKNQRESKAILHFFRDVYTCIFSCYTKCFWTNIREDVNMTLTPISPIYSRMICSLKILQSLSLQYCWMCRVNNQQEKIEPKTYLQIVGAKYWTKHHTKRVQIKIKHCVWIKRVDFGRYLGNLTQDIGRLFCISIFSSLPQGKRRNSTIEEKCVKIERTRELWHLFWLVC